MTGASACSVWPVAQRSARAQRSGRYVPETTAHPARTLPDLARAVIATYTAPGDLVVDPMCGSGTTLAEAIRLGRDAIGVEYDPRWALLSHINVGEAREDGATGHAEIHVGDGRGIGTTFGADARGSVALVLTSPPYGPQHHGRVEAGPAGVAKWDFRYSTDPTNLGNAPTSRLLPALRDILDASARMLRPDGVVVLTVRPWRRDGQLIDLPGQLVHLAASVGLTLAERNVALLCGVGDDGLVPRASFFQLLQCRRSIAAGTPQLVIAHEDVLVFRRRP